MKKYSISVVLLFLCIVLSSCFSDKNNEITETGNETTSFKVEITETESTTGYNEDENSVDVQTEPMSSDRCFYGKYTGTDKTFTGYEPLPLLDFSDVKSDKLDSMPRTMISHSYGVAKNEKPHEISVTNQKFFDEKEFDAVCLDPSADDKLVYLTFDCGYENGFTSKILDTLKEKNVKAAFFCTLPQVKENSELIARMIREGHIVGNHSVTHPDFSSLSESEIIEEIKGFDDYMREKFGYSSLYFRYPQGKYSEYALTVLNSLGFKCVFCSLAYADWETDNQKGAMYAYETVMSRIHPGAVILLHSVSSDNAGALGDIIDSCREKGYEFCSLEDM